MGISPASRRDTGALIIKIKFCAARPIVRGLIARVCNRAFTLYVCASVTYIYIYILANESKCSYVDIYICVCIYTYIYVYVMYTYIEAKDTYVIPTRAKG